MHTRTKIKFNALVILALLALSGHLNAQTLFRCGRTYQDRPCESAKDEKTITHVRASQSAEQSVSDANCVQQGMDAQRIAWAREAGAMLDQQLAKAASGRERKLIADVYAKRAPSSEIRAAIEADCVAEKKKAAELAALAAAMGATSGSPVMQGNRQEAQIRPESNPNRNDAAQNAKRQAEQKQAECDHLKSEYDDLQVRQRNGGSIAAMESLHREGSDIEKRRGQAGCR